MKITNFAKPLWAGAIVIALSALPSVPASAQTNTAPNTSPDTTTDLDDDVDDDDGFDWGWLGLLGLIGLAGLKRKPEQRTVYHDPNVETTTRPDYRR
jgi:hypothetical protein